MCSGGRGSPSLAVAIMVVLFVVGISMGFYIGSCTAQGYYLKIIYFPNYPGSNKEGIHLMDCMPEWIGV